MLFGMIQPMTSFARDNESIYLVSFDPNNLVNSFISPLS